MEIGRNMIRALEGAAAAVNQVHPELKLGVIGDYHEGRKQKGGWVERAYYTVRLTSLHAGAVREFGLRELRWQVTDAEGALCLLLHEAAHCLAQVRVIRETSRQGRYHNEEFRRLALELGLKTTWRGSYREDWANDELLETTRRTYRVVISRLQKAIELDRSPDVKGAEIPADKPSGTSRLLKATCPGCGRIVRASRQTFDVGPILCQPCGQPFAVSGP